MIRPLSFPFQLLTVALGVILFLPLQIFSLPLLFFIPGVAFFLLYKGAKQIDILETLTYSISLSLVVIPTAATFVFFVGVGIGLTSVAIGLAIIAASILSFAIRKKGVKPPEVDSQIVSPTPSGSGNGFSRMSSRSSCGERAAETVT